MYQVDENGHKTEVDGFVNLVEENLQVLVDVGLGDEWWE